MGNLGFGEIFIIGAFFIGVPLSVIIASVIHSRNKRH